MNNKDASINYSQIKHLIQVVNSSISKDQEIVKHQFQQDFSVYDEVVDFLLKLNLLELKADKIYVKEPDLFTHGEKRVKHLLLDRVQENISELPLTQHFLSHFQLDNSKYCYQPSPSDNILFSGVRNLLLELDALQYDKTRRTYKLIYIPLVAVTYPTGTFSPTALYQLMDRNNELGRRAEIEVIKFEEERLHDLPNLVKAIEYTASVDTRAGYDIKSYEIDGAIRYIEVKAVSPVNLKFYWSTNEIDAASLYGKQYYLYLLPVKSIDQFDLNAMEIIQDPYKNVFLDKKLWSKTEKVYTIWKDQK